jgi:O-antigen/teichoic acid export membrane protein
MRQIHDATPPCPTGPGEHAPGPVETRRTGGLARKTAANSAFSFAAFLYTAALTAVGTPILVHHLGTEKYGVLSLALTTVAFLGVLDVGLSTSLVKFLATDVALGRYREVSRIAGAGIVAYAGLGLLGAGAAAAFGAGPADEIFDFSPDIETVAALTFALVGAGFFFTLTSRVFGSAVAANQRLDVTAAVRALIATVTWGGGILAIYSGYGLGGVALAIAVAPAVGLVVVAVASLRVVPGFRPVPNTHLRILRQTFGFGLWIFVASTSGFLLLQFDRFVLGALKGASEVTYYAVPGNVGSYLYAAIVTLASIVIPVSSDLAARGDAQRLSTLYVRASRLIVIAMLSAAIPLIVFAHRILLYWIGSDFAARSTGVLRLLVVTYVILGLMVIPYNVAVGVGRPKVLAAWNVGMFALNAVLMVLLIPPFGINGAALAYLGSVLPGLGFIAYVERRLLHRAGDGWRSLVRRIAVPVLAQTLACLLLVHAIVNLASAAVVTLVSTLLLSVVYYALRPAGDEDRQLLTSILRRRP